jgi:iron complex transport system substrate-binding protein
MGSHKSLVGATLVAIMITLAACQRPPETGSTPDSAPTGRSASVRIVTDDLGRQITVPVNVTRVVSTAPSVTEMIFAVGAGDRLVGVTTFCDYPEEAKPIAKIGDTMTPNMESIIALKPDIVFVSTASQIEAFMKTLEQNGIAVYVMNPMNLSEVIGGLQRIAIIFGNEREAEVYAYGLMKRQANVSGQTLMSRLDPGHEDQEFKIQPVNVFVQISDEPLFTVGKASFLNDLIRTAGGRSVTADVATAYPKLSKETASALNPEVIILSDSPDNQKPNEAFKNSPAVKNGRVYKINADIISRPGPRLVDALEQIARLLHPEKFK